MKKTLCSITLLSISIIGLIQFASLSFAEDRKRPVTGKFSVMPEIGTDFTVGGDFVKSASESATLTLTGGSTIAANVSSNSQDFDDVYHSPFKVGMDVNYGLTDYTEVFFGLNYTKAEAKNFDALTVDAAGSFAGIAISPSETISGKFDDYREFGFGVGTRHFFNRFGTLTPYVSLEGGLTHNENIELNLSTAGGRISDIGFYEDTWKARLEFGGGFLYDVSDAVSVGVESGIDYDFGMDGDDSVLNNAGAFERTNDDGDRLSIPLMFSIRVKF